MVRTTISLAGILIAGAIFFLYTQPSYDNAQGVRDQIAQYDAALAKAAELQTLKAALLARYNAFNPADIERLQKLLPDHVDNIRLILDMDNLAVQRNMELSNVDISGNNSNAKAQQTVIGALGASNQKYDSLTIGFTTIGTYTNFKLFLEDLQKSLRIVDFTELSITPSSKFSSTQGGQSEPTFSYGIKLKTYWLK